MARYKRTYNPCDDCPYSYSKNNQDSGMCKICEFKELLDSTTADVVEVRHGKWVHTDYAMHWLGKDECSECTYHTSDRDDLSHFNFCPNCGARMDGDAE